MAHKARGVMRAVGEGALAGYGTGAAVTSAVGGAHAAARHASHMMGAARGMASAAVANQHMPGDLPGPRSAAFYANRYGYSGAGHLSGTESQVSLFRDTILVGYVKFGRIWRWSDQGSPSWGVSARPGFSISGVPASGAHLLNPRSVDSSEKLWASITSF